VLPEQLEPPQQEDGPEQRGEGVEVDPPGAMGADARYEQLMHKLECHVRDGEWRRALLPLDVLGGVVGQR
jgi:hypothetical protein